MNYNLIQCWNSWNLISRFHNFTDLANVPTSRGCHIQFPSGCSSQKSPKYKQYQNKTAWSYYDWKGSSDSMENCYSKQKGLNDWCGIHDVVMIFNKGMYVIHNMKIMEIFHKCFYLFNFPIMEK